MSIIDWSSDVCSSDLQKEKTTLTGLYEARLIEANAVAGLLQTIEPGLRDRLRQASERFEATAKRNALSLRAAMELNNRLVQTIAEASSEEHTSELQSLMRISYAVFCLKKKKTANTTERQETPMKNLNTAVNKSPTNTKL